MEIDQAAAKLWGLTSPELSAVRCALGLETTGPAKADESETLYPKAP